MGAWGEGNFENDGALDFVGDLTEQDSLQPVEAAFDAALQALADEDYIDAFYAEQVLAAAEVVAMLKGQPVDKLPPKLTQWQQAQRLTVDDALDKKAIAAVEKVMTDPESELRELWAETDDFEAWLATVKDLLERLRQ